MKDRYAIAVREELWLGGRLVESRLSHGEARSADDLILASDEGDPELLVRSARALDSMRRALPAGRSARLLAEASTDGDGAWMILPGGGAALVTSPEHLPLHLPLLQRAEMPPRVTAGCRGIPLLWTCGSAAVLFHEAGGHPAEVGATPAAWPTWISAHDGTSDLLAGEPPRALRRALFGDVPIRRMREVRVAHSGAPFQRPERRIEILLVDGGSWDPLTDEVQVVVRCADLWEADEATPLAPFVVSASRAEIAASLRGAGGEVRRYPGVVCSREGQELVVESFAPDVLMELE